MRFAIRLGASIILIAGCAHTANQPPASSSTPAQPSAEHLRAANIAPEAGACSGAIAARFYDVGQGLAVLVTLPDGKHVLVDTGNGPKRPGCGNACKIEHAHFTEQLRQDLGDAPIDLLWITHQHWDHLGGAPDLLGSFRISQLMESGRDSDATSVKATEDAAKAAGVPIVIIDTDHPNPRLPAGLQAIVPSQWTAS